METKILKTHIIHLEVILSIFQYFKHIHPLDFFLTLFFIFDI